MDVDVSNGKALLERIHELSSPLAPIASNHPVRLKSLEGIRCVAFDFYGTMFMSGVGDIGIDEEQEKESEVFFRESLKSSGFSILDNSAGLQGLEILKNILDEWISNARDKGIPYPEPEIREVWADTLNELLKLNLIEGTVSESSINRFAIEFEFRINNIWPVPDLKQVLQDLLKNNIYLGIISNSQFYTPIAFEAFLGRSPQTFGFEPNLLVWSFACGRKKPDTGFYQIFVDRLPSKNLTPEQVLYVGNDIRKDIEPAKLFGMRTALFVGDQRSIRHQENDLREEPFKPDLVINSLSQISDCLNLKP